MKKKMVSKSVNWMRDVGLKAFAVLALVVGGFYAYTANIDYPPEPNATTGVVGTFVGSSEYDAPSNGVFSVASEYKEVNKYCSQAGRATPNSNLLGSHICTPDEMTNSYNHINAQSALFLINPVTTPFLYINNGPPGYLASANDCGGWSRTDAGANPQYPNYGSIWDFSQKMGRITVCTTGTKFACCK